MAIAWIAVASERLGVSLREHVPGQAVGPCPRCRAGDDRFVVWEEGGNAWCRKCGHRAFWTDRDEPWDAAASRLEKAERTATARAGMANCLDWLAYHEHPRSRSLWQALGMTAEEWGEYRLGYCDRCPNDAQRRASVTIPVWVNGILVDIRHRIISAQRGDKYRSHRAGVRPSTFNLDVVGGTDHTVYLVEGERKAIFLSRVLRPVLGFPGVGFFDDAMDDLASMALIKEVIIFPDPDAREAIESRRTLARGFRVSIIDILPGYKPDDFLLRYGAGAVRLLVEQRRVLIR